MKLTCTVQPITQPITLAEAKSFCRVLTNDDDAIISLLIDAATDYAQNVTGRQLCSATFQLKTGALTSPLQLPKAPFKEITSVTSGGVALDYSLHYDVDVAFIEFMAIEDVTITFTCGYDIMPASLKAWCLNKVSSLYENREEIVVGLSVSEIPKSMIDCILDHYKVRYL
jgi:uncharacterized phiE125 gp8 family phage protein